MLTQDVRKVVQAGGAYDGSGDAWLGEHPCDGDLRHAHALLLGQLFDPVYVYSIWKSSLAAGVLA